MLNSAIIMGRLTAAPELKTTKRLNEAASLNIILDDEEQEEEENEI